jgi:hypothetical protein
VTRAASEKLSDKLSAFDAGKVICEMSLSRTVVDIVLHLRLLYVFKYDIGEGGIARATLSHAGKAKLRHRNG